MNSDYHKIRRLLENEKELGPIRWTFRLCNPLLWFVVAVLSFAAAGWLYCADAGAWVMVASLLGGFSLALAAGVHEGCKEAVRKWETETEADQA